MASRTPAVARPLHVNPRSKSPCVVPESSTGEFHELANIQAAMPNPMAMGINAFQPLKNRLSGSESPRRPGRNRSGPRAFIRGMRIGARSRRAMP
jgi:hypothetical protein